ncbi:MAG: glycosyltransferase family 2 protein [Planctomycetes bacterium]|nr:glycosyltransferase family 2 protein [Planctomycetota bacterium]
MTPTLSANLITLDEERNLAPCLQSLAWVDEMVVVDGGSRDRTVEIARRYTDRVLVHTFDDYASQRNRALDESRGEWVISIDADERVPVELAREIRRMVADATPHMSGFWVPIRSRIFGRRFRFSGTQGERKMRLFRGDRARWHGPVHETVTLHGPTGQLRHAIEHESTPDLETYFRKLERYSSLEAERIRAGCDSPAWWRPWLLPLWTFARLYLGNLGVFDGPEGLRFCALSGLGTWMAYRKFLARLDR